MDGLLFTLTDNNGVEWAGKRLSVDSPDVWLIFRYHGSNNWITKRKLGEQEVEEYQKLAGCYTRG